MRLYELAVLRSTPPVRFRKTCVFFERERQIESFPQPLRVRFSVILCNPPGLIMVPVEGIGVIPRKHMHVEMPDVLISGRFVVLADRRAFASVSSSESHCNALREIPHCVPVLRAERVDVLNVCPRNHENRTGVTRPPLRRDTSKRTLGDGDDVRRLVALIEDALLKPTEGARVSIWFMGGGKHARLSHEVGYAAGDVYEIRVH